MEGASATALPLRAPRVKKNGGFRSKLHRAPRVGRKQRGNSTAWIHLEESRNAVSSNRTPPKIRRHRSSDTHCIAGHHCSANYPFFAFLPEAFVRCQESHH